MIRICSFESKGFLSSNFDMKDLGNASYVLGIEIHRDRTRGVLSLSQKANIEKVLKRYNIHECSATPISFMKGNKLGTFQSIRNQFRDRSNEIDYLRFSYQNHYVCLSLYVP
jgi:hypothetical protein